MQITTIKQINFETLQAIEDIISEQNYPPSYRQLMLRLGLKSPAPVQYRLNVLIEAQIISVTPGHSRSLQVLMPSTQFKKVGKVYRIREESIAQ